MYTAEGSEGSSHPGPLAGTGHRKPEKPGRKHSVVSALHGEGARLTEQQCCLASVASPSFLSDVFHSYLASHGPAVTELIPKLEQTDLKVLPP